MPIVSIFQCTPQKWNRVCFGLMLVPPHSWMVNVYIIKERGICIIHCTLLGKFPRRPWSNKRIFVCGLFFKPSEYIKTEELFNQLYSLDWKRRWRKKNTWIVNKSNLLAGFEKQTTLSQISIHASSSIEKNFRETDCLFKTYSVHWESNLRKWTDLGYFSSQSQLLR